MEFVKNFRQTKLIKYLFIALLGSIVLAISSKIKIGKTLPFLVASMKASLSSSLRSYLNQTILFTRNSLNLKAHSRPV